MRRRLLLLAVGALVVWGVVAALWVFRVASDLQEGRDAASEARDHLGAEEIADRVPLGDLRRARVRFAAAHDRADGLVLAPLRVFPVIGRQLASVRALSGAAEVVARAGVDAIVRAGKVFDDPAGAGSARVAQVRELSSVVDDVADRLTGIDDLGPRNALLAPLADARNDLAADLADARRSIVDAQAGAHAALSLVTGPRRYLVLAANSAEMRAGSGMWLQGGALVTEDGKLDLEDMVSLHLDADPPDGAVAATGDLASRWGFLEPGDEWRNLMASPDFPASAELATRMWKAAGRGDVDGVIAVDALGLAAIVEATGPVEVDGTSYDADAIPEQVLHDQYLQFGDISSQSGRGNAERREALAGIAKAAVHAIDAGDYPASKLIRTLGDAIRGRHLLAWTRDDVEQAGWTAAGMDGTLQPDSLLVSILNRGGNKLDWFLDVRSDLHVERAPDGWDVSVDLTLTNRAPAGDPAYIQGPYPGLGLDAGTYRGILAVNVPGTAHDSRFEGVDDLAVAGPDGPTRVVGFQLELRRNETRTVVLRFRLPVGADHLVVEPSARVPGITWHFGARSWKDSASRAAKW
jgi:hypothetical protein